MSRFNHYFANDFAACKLLAKTHDPHRNRDVRLYMVPGIDDAIGVTDGVDKWIAPVAGDPFGINIRQVMADVRGGGKPYEARPAGTAPGGRRKLLQSDSPPDPQPSPPPRRKLISEPQPEAQLVRRRHVVRA